MSDKYLKCPCGRVYHVCAEQPKGFRSIVVMIKHLGDFLPFVTSGTLAGLEVEPHDD